MDSWGHWRHWNVVIVYLSDILNGQTNSRHKLLLRTFYEFLARRRPFGHWDIVITLDLFSTWRKP